VNIVEKFAASFNRQDVDALLACFTTGATYRDALYGDHAGTESLRGMFERMFREGRDCTWTMDTIVASPRRAAAEWTFSYVVTEAVPRSAGRRIHLRGMSLFELEGDQIAAHREYVDTGVVMLQLGLTPGSIAKVLARRL
jgi:steroid delta-isomerase-like uncharacterized protein